MTRPRQRKSYSEYEMGKVYRPGDSVRVGLGGGSPMPIPIAYHLGLVFKDPQGEGFKRSFSEPLREAEIIIGARYNPPAHPPATPMGPEE